MQVRDIEPCLAQLPVQFGPSYLHPPPLTLPAPQEYKQMLNRHKCGAYLHPVSQSL